MLKRLGIAGQLDMDDQAERGQVDAACGADAGAAVAQCLKRVVALGLAVLARQRHGGKAALDQIGVEVADIVARRAEQHRRLRLVKAQQVDHGVLDIRRRDGDRLIGDVAMAAILAHGRNAQRVALIALGQRDDRLGERGGEQEGAPLGRGRVEQRLQLLAKAHVEHFVGFIEHRDLERRQVERAALEMVAQPARRADDHMRAMRQRAPLARGVHAADAGRDPRARCSIEPAQFLGDLKCQFARRGDHKRQRQARRGKRTVIEQVFGHGEAKGDGLARPGLGRDQQVAAARIVLRHLGLDGGQRFVTALRKRLGEAGGKVRKGHQAHKLPRAPQAARCHRSGRGGLRGP